MFSEASLHRGICLQGGLNFGGGGGGGYYRVINQPDTLKVYIVKMHEA